MHNQRVKESTVAARVKKGFKEGQLEIEERREKKGGRRRDVSGGD